MYIKRTLTSYIKRMLTKFPIVSITGPRQSGKTTLLKNEFPDYKYFNLERIDHRQLIMNDPVGFLKTSGENLIFDEAQNYPDLFSYLQIFSDERNIPGQYILSGSQSFLLNEKISQSLAGRVSINHLLPFDIIELQDIKTNNVYEEIYNGFYPRVIEHGINPDDFYPSYLQTYIERDVRTLKAIGNLNTFTRFISLCAGRVGQILNISSLANDAGISVNTAKSWLSLLEASFIIYMLPPFFKNFNKRLIKSPKIYFYDTGLVCSLLRITESNMISTHYLYGNLFENLVISEIVKFQYHHGRNPGIYYWRDSNGVEIDCIMEKGNNEIFAIEIKGGQTFSNEYMKNLKKLQKLNIKMDSKIIYTGEISTSISGVELIAWKDFKSFLLKM
ncbi:MAG TPA: ATP-binding protein [Bacteroidetes bacterium]|nr:ATP-binding protein [Bacteroidota bacterium]